MPYETTDANEELVKTRVCLVSQRPWHSLQNPKRCCLPLPTPANQSPPGLPSFFIPRNIRIKAFLPYPPFSGYNVKRLVVEGHQPPPLTTVSAAMPGKSTRCSWRGAGAQPPARPASRCPGLAAAIGVHLLACHHLLAKMVKSHTQRPAGWGELNLSLTGSQTAATARAAQRGVPHKRRKPARLGLGGHLIPGHGGGLLLVLTRKGSLNKSRELLPDKKAWCKLPIFF